MVSEQSTVDRGRKRERGGYEPVREGLVERLWGQYEPGGGNYRQRGGRKVLGENGGVGSVWDGRLRV